MTKENIETIKEPFDLIRLKIIEDFFNVNMFYVKDLVNQILNYNKPFPVLCLHLRDVMIFNEELFSYIKKEPENAIEDICDILLKNAKLNSEINNVLNKDDKCKFERIRISFDLEEIKEDIDLYDTFSLGTKPFINRLIRIRGRFLDLKLFRENVATKISYECQLCGATVDIIQVKGRRGKYRKPNFCINRHCKAKGSNDFRSKKVKEYHEVGSFRIGDLDFSKPYEKECCTIIDFDYFSEKVQRINLNDIIEIIGIIKLDTSEVGTRKEDQIIHEYIEVLDFNSIELKITDPTIIDELYNHFKEDRDYHHQILDSIHPLTREIYTFRLFKIITLLGFISSDSWDTITKNRCSINFIVGSVPSLFKGSITSEFRKIMGVNNIGKMSGQDNTPKAFIPTSQRGKEGDFQTRYGAFAYNNKRFLIVDEGQDMLKNRELAKPIKYLEDGEIDRGSDGSMLHAECKLSVAFLINYINNEDNEGYNYNLSLRENLGGIDESILQRIDLHYTMHNLPIYLMDILERRSFDKNEAEICPNIIYNYLNEAKRLYPLQHISSSMEKKLIEFIKALRTARDKNTQNIREFRTLIKLVCGISAMRLKTEVDESDVDYLEKHLVDLMVPFFNYINVRRMKLEQLNMNEIFQNTFRLLAGIKGEIAHSDHISFIRQVLIAHYFPEDNNNEINKYMPGTLNSNNRKYRTLLEHEENLEYIEYLGYTKALDDNSNIYIKMGQE